MVLSCGGGRRQRETEEWIQAYYFLGLTPYRGTDFILSNRMAEAMKDRREAEDDTAGSRTIGKLAKEAQVNVETIRFYEWRGLLLRPKAPVSGWRVYPLHKISATTRFHAGGGQKSDGRSGRRKAFLRFGATSV